MSCHCYDWHRTESCDFLHLLCDSADALRGVDISSELAFFQSDCLYEFLVDGSGSRVEHLSCGEHSVFAYRLASEHIHESIRDEQDFVGHTERRVVVFDHRAQLEQRVELHKLDSRLLVYRLLGNDFEIFLHGVVGVRVAVTVGITQHTPVFSDADEVTSPSVDTDGCDFDFFLCHHLESFYDLVVERIDVPEEMSSGLYDVVRESCDFPLLQFSVHNTSQYSPAAGGPQVDSKEISAFHL